MPPKKKTEIQEGAEETAAPVERAQPEVEKGEAVLFTTADDYSAEERAAAVANKRALPAYSPEYHAAIVIDVRDDGAVDLLVHSPQGDYRKAAVRFTDAKPGTAEAAGCWAFRPAPAL